MKTKTAVGKDKAGRTVRREHQRHVARVSEERNRQKSRRGDQLNEQGVTQGQNAEQGNTTDPRQARPLGKLSH